MVYPWAVVPTHLGMGYGGLPTFLSWLRRYPTLGPWNAEILAGIGCVLGAAAMPVVFTLATRRWGRGPLLGLFLLSLVPWVAVVWRLDVELVAMGILGLPTLFSLEPGPFWPLVFGPLMRTLAVLGMAAGLMQRWRAAPNRRE